MWFSVFVFLFGVILFFVHGFHLLMLLLGIEMSLLGLLVYLILAESVFGLGVNFFFLLVLVCMGGLIFVGWFIVERWVWS